MEEKTVRIHIPDVPADLHHAVKVAAAEDGRSLKEWVKDALEAILKLRANKNSK